MRSYYETSIGRLKSDIARRKNLEVKYESLKKSYKNAQSDMMDMLDAQTLLSSVSDDITDTTLSFITSAVNKVLAEVFSSSVRKIRLKKKLYSGSRPHIIVELVDGEGNVLDMKVQSGTGIAQVVSFMFSLCLIEIRKGRRLFFPDESLNGLHKEAKGIISEVIKLFAEDGFQFVFVDYGMNNIGKIYNIEKVDGVSHAYALDDASKYDENRAFMFSNVDLSLLDDDYVDENDGDEEIITS